MPRVLGLLGAGILFGEPDQQVVQDANWDCGVVSRARMIQAVNWQHALERSFNPRLATRESN